MTPEYQRFLQLLQERNEVLTMMAFVGVSHAVAYSLLPRRFRHILAIWVIVSVILTIAAFWYYGSRP